jgi:hypothetical protein
MFGKNMLSRKINIVLYEKNQPPQTLKGKLYYDKKIKTWYVAFGGENVPAPENVSRFIINNTLHLEKVGTNSYSYLDFNEFIQRDKQLKTAKTDIDPAQIYSSIVKAQTRLERNKSALEKIIPIVMIIIALIGVGIFIAIVWSSTGQNMLEISKNFNEATKTLASLIEKQNQIISNCNLPTPPSAPAPR